MATGVAMIAHRRRHRRHSPPFLLCFEVDSAGIWSLVGPKLQSQISGDLTHLFSIPLQLSCELELINIESPSLPLCCFLCRNPFFFPPSWESVLLSQDQPTHTWLSLAQYLFKKLTKEHHRAWLERSSNDIIMIDPDMSQLRQGWVERWHENWLTLDSKKQSEKWNLKTDTSHGIDFTALAATNSFNWENRH